MTPRDRVVAVLNGQKPSVIPSLSETPMDVTVFSDLLGPTTGDGVQDAIRQAEFFDNSAVGIGLGIKQQSISKDERCHRYRYETGAIWREEYEPTFCREPLSFPINSPHEALHFQMPDANQADRFDHQQMRQAVKKFHDAGFFVQGSVIGAWQGIYYYLTSFDNILMWMASEPEAAHALFAKTAKFSLDSARRLLEIGVDAVFPPSDLGLGQGLLFSPGMFREYVFGWLKELAELCHQYGAYLHLHSHGHIEELMDDIVAAGVDIINPIGPSGHNDLTLFKRRWGDRITLHGGISTTIAGMTKAQMQAHIEDVISIGRCGGRFFPRSESGIPPMPREKALFYIGTLKQYRQRGYE